MRYAARACSFLSTILKCCLRQIRNCGRTPLSLMKTLQRKPVNMLHFALLPQRGYICVLSPECMPIATNQFAAYRAPRCLRVFPHHTFSPAFTSFRAVRPATSTTLYDNPPTFRHMPINPKEEVFSPRVLKILLLSLTFLAFTSMSR